MFVLLARQSIAKQRAADTQLWAEQARWVAEAALERTAARLATDANYTGETWTLSAADLSDKDDGLAKIRVEKIADRPDRRLVQVEADYPNDPVHRSRWAKQVTMNCKTPVAPKVEPKAAKSNKTIEESENSHEKK